LLAGCDLISLHSFFFLGAHGAPDEKPKKKTRNPRQNQKSRKTKQVFTDDQLSYTSWFLDAFNHAMDAPVHVINLSIGGPDYLDRPFVDKVLEVTARGILLVSAIGNDGPLYGTLNNPADQPDVIGVGGVDRDGALAPFSSRGMSTWELPQGTGRAKPDVVAWARDVPGSRMDGGGCRTLSGTSVASPVVAGCVALLASTVAEEQRWGPRGLLNPASMKQALVEGARRVAGANQFEQGAGRVSLRDSQAVLAKMAGGGGEGGKWGDGNAAAPTAQQPQQQLRASLHPPRIDLTDCPYAWPYCKQPLHARAMPVVVNATILNALGPVGRVVGAPTFEPSPADGDGGRYLHVSFTWSETLWPWSGHLSVHAEVSPQASNFTGPATGTIRFRVESPAPQRSKAAEGGNGTAAPPDLAAAESFATDPKTGQPIRTSEVVVPFTARIAPPPPRHHRVLWDVFHSVRYPPGYLPRDNLDVRGDILDWHGDHPFTNYHDALDALLDNGYSVEILSSPSTCFDAKEYGALLIVDSEDEWYEEERRKLAADVKEQGLALVVFAEWYNAASLGSMRFYDDNTRSWWLPATGGGNVPAVNELLAEVGGEVPATDEAVLPGEEEDWEEEGEGGKEKKKSGGRTKVAVPAGPAIAFGDAIVKGDATVAGIAVNVAYGAAVARMPAGSWLHRAALADHAAPARQTARAAFGLGPGGDGGGGEEEDEGEGAKEEAASGAAAGRRRTRRAARRRVHLDGRVPEEAGERGRVGAGQRRQHGRHRRRALHQQPADDTAEDAGADGEPGDLPAQQKRGEHGALGVAPVGKGKVLLFADSNCLDSSHNSHRCHDLLLALLRRYAADTPEEEAKAASPLLEDDSARLGRQYTSSRWARTAAATAPLLAKHGKAEDKAAAAAARFAGPARRPGGAAAFDAVSFVRRRPHQAYMSAPCAFRARLGGPGAEGREESATTAGWACPAAWGGGEEDKGAPPPPPTAGAEDDDTAAAAATAKQGGAQPWAAATGGSGNNSTVRAPQATAGGGDQQEASKEEALPLAPPQQTTPPPPAAARPSALADAPRQREEEEERPPAPDAGLFSAALPSILRHALNLAFAICMVGGGAMVVLAWSRRRAAAAAASGGAAAGAGGAGGGRDDGAGSGAGGLFGRAGRLNPLRRLGTPAGVGSIALAERGTADEQARLLRAGGGGGSDAATAVAPPGLASSASRSGSRSALDV
jgi:hypothetical protein